MPSPLPFWPTVKRCPTFAWVASLTLFLVAGEALPAPQRPDRRRQAPPVTALKVGTIHPVSGPAIRNGVILIGGGQILGVGTADQVRIPAGAKVEEFPDAHAYPGLVDALSTAFATQQELANASVDAGADFADALDPTDEASRKLVRYGVTTAYVSNRSTGTWRGRGAIVRPTALGYTMLRDKRHGGLSLRMTTGSTAGHALDRLKKFDSTGNVFDGLEDYEKQQKDYAKALADYDKAYKSYLDHYRKRSKPGGKPATATPPNQPAPTRPAGAPPTRERDTGTPGERRGRRGFGERRRRPGTPPATGNGPTGTTTPPARPAPSGEQDKSSTGKSGASAASGPKKPTYPKQVAKDPAKESLLAVVEGKLPLRVEVHRQDEIRAALFMAMIKELPGIVLEFASDAAEIAKEIAEAGAPVVVSNLLDSAADAEAGRNRAALPAALHGAGVPVAIGSGGVANARNLTMMAAYACGHGLPEDAAIRALTLTPAEILGVDDRVGSLARRKFADILLTSGPLLHSSTRVLRVISQGTTQYEAK